MKSIFILLVFIGVLFLPACTAPSNAERVLREQGYTDIRLTGYAFFMCSEKDNFATGFVATSPSGVEVQGAVCSGFLKGSTIRFN